ncbi:MAG TPA: glycosyltransferase family 2 protein [Solirubrobacteraceae bacterium]|jgi:GT2 family glycosyltransferase|nr:glycosyltransferase family 2 protein [Solirubrobacteraceae bacterium]
MSEAKPSTTILVLSVDEAPLLVHSLPAAVAQPGAHVVVIDNASTDETRTVAESCGARVIGLGKRLSYAAAINAGIVGSEGEAVLLLNADCVLDTGFLAAARPRLDQGGVGSVAPRLIRASGMEAADRLDRLDAAGMVIDRRRKNTLVGHNEPVTGYLQAAEVFGGDGACVLYRREVLDACAVGGEVFDEDLELWASDVDLAWRARLLGWRCMYEPRAVAWHMRFYSPTTRSGLPEAHRRLQFRNRLLMMAKNDSWADLRGDLHRIAFYEVLALGHVILRERHLLRAYGAALRALPATRRRRAVVQATRSQGARAPFGLRAPR